MKRIITAVFATASALVLLFTYKTSLDVVMPEAADSSATTATSGAGTSTNSRSDTGTDASSATGTDSGTSSGSESGSSSSTGADPSDGSDSSSGTGSTSGSTTPTSGLVDGTYTGTTVSTRYGAVQVAVTVSGGAITDVQVPQYPVGDRKDQQINSVAVPELVQETLRAQSADIQMISGATYTSEGYVQSLQSALDQAAS